MGAKVKLLLYAADEPSANLAAAAAYGRIAALDATLSDYKTTSELSQLSRTAGSGEVVRIGDDLWTVLAEGQRLSEATDGAFDVTVGPMVRLWRRARRSGELPSPERLAEARGVVGYQRLRLDAAAQTAELETPGMRLDLGGIAMGYALDEALAVLAEHGVNRALIDGSGDIVVGDPPPGETGWRVQAEPLSGSDQAPRFVRLANRSVTTSGDAYQHVVIDGRRYSHIVDPRTGLGLSDPSSVTVIADSGIAADSLATAVSVLGPERGLALIECTPGAAALVQVNAGARGVVSTRESKRWREFVGKGEE